MQTWWKGPYQIVERLGEKSFRVEIKSGQLQDVHMDQLKKCEWDMEVLQEDPLFYKEGQTIPSFQEDAPVREVLGHRVNEEGTLEFHVTRGLDVDARWEPVQKFLMACDDAWLEYVKNSGVEVQLPECLLDIQGWAAVMAGELERE